MVSAMTTLYDAYLPIVQSLNAYGGITSSKLVSRAVLDEIDSLANADDKSAKDLRHRLLSLIEGLNGIQDYQGFSSFIENYYECVFFLLAKHRGVPVSSIPAGGAHGQQGKSADFATVSEPVIRFEFKTIDVYDPRRTYSDAMSEGLDSKIEADDAAAKSAESTKSIGIGFGVRKFAPHGRAKDRREAVEQVMRKIDGNIKRDQYTAGPTFLVVSLSRSSVHDCEGNLKKRVSYARCKTLASGQLYAIAAHNSGDEFYYFPEPDITDPLDMPLFIDPDVDDPVSLGPLNRSGILRDHEHIAGIIFVRTELSELGNIHDVDRAFHLNGIWNDNWSANQPSDLSKLARATFEKICHAYNDLSDSRAAHLQDLD